MLTPLHACVHTMLRALIVLPAQVSEGDGWGRISIITSPSLLRLSFQVVVVGLCSGQLCVGSLSLLLCLWLIDPPLPFPLKETSQEGGRERVPSTQVSIAFFSLLVIPSPFSSATVAIFHSFPSILSFAGSISQLPSFFFSSSHLFSDPPLFLLLNISFCVAFCRPPPHGALPSYTPLAHLPDCKTCLLLLLLFSSPFRLCVSRGRTKRKEGGGKRARGRRRSDTRYLNIIEGKGEEE